MKKLISHSKPTLDNYDYAKVNLQLKSKMIASGDINLKFSEKLSNYLMKSKVSLFSSASSGLFYILKTLDLKEKNDILLPNYICESVIKSILLAGLNPIIYDNEPNSWNSNSHIIEKSITKKTGAIIVNHTFGIRLNGINKLAKTNIPIIEDCCHVLSPYIQDERISNHSICSFYSFDSTKWIATGNGGAVASDNIDFINQMESIKVDQGISDLNCSLGISQLEKIDNLKLKRNEIANEYFKKMPSITKNLHDLKSCFFRFPIIINNEMDFLKSKRVSYKKGVDKLLSNKYQKDKSFINSEKIFQKTISVPIYPSLKKREIEIIIDETKKIFYGD